MPIYVYRCKYCGIDAEYLLPYKHKIPKCPNCNRKMTRVISAPAVIFKGTDFPTNDFKRYRMYKKGEIQNEEG